jgi:hypothetical protein
MNSRRRVNSTVMRLINSSDQVITFRRLMAVTLLAGLTGCGSLVRPGSIKVADSTRAVADARKLIAEEREKPSKPMRAPEELPESLRIPGLRYADIHDDHVNLVLYHDPMVTRGARIWSLDTKREHRDTPTKYPDVYFFDYTKDAPKAPDNIY